MSLGKYIDDLSNLPDNVKAYPHWVLWKSENRYNAEKATKVPYSIAGHKASSTEPSHWSSFDDAFDAFIMSSEYAGLGIVLVEDSPLIVIDLDGVGEWRGGAKKIIDQFNGLCYAENSPSGNGVHILTVAEYPEGSRTRSKDFHNGKAEVYNTGRFITMTGSGGRGDIQCEGEVINPKATAALHKFMDPLTRAAQVELATIDDDDLYARITMSDDDIIQGLWMEAEKKPEGGAAAFRQLYENGFEEDDDASMLMTTCVGTLAVWTQNLDQIKSILASSDYIAAYADMASGAPKFERWFASEAPKILKARISQVEKRAKETFSEFPEFQGLALDQFLVIAAEGPTEFWNTKFKRRLSQQGLNSHFAPKHTGEKGSPLASTVLLKNPEVARISGTMWMPTLYGSDPGEIIRYRGIPYANSYAGYMIEPKAGDVSTWLKLCHMIMPDDEIRENFIKRMAVDVQFPGESPNWHTVLTGLQGAGKDSVLQPLKAIYGDAAKLASNREMKGGYDNHLRKTKIVIGSEIRQLKGEALETVKSLTGSSSTDLIQLNIKAKAMDVQAAIWSFYIVTNNDDPIQADKTERRFFVVKCNKHEDATSEFFDHYYEWMKAEGGPAMFDYLLNLDITGFNYKGNAPKTAAFYEMAEDSKSDIEFALDEMCGEDDGWFQKGLANTVAITEAIKARRIHARPVDVKQYFERTLGWVRLEKPQAKIDGKKMSLSRNHYAPADSDLHFMTPTNLYHHIKKELSDFF